MRTVCCVCHKTKSQEGWVQQQIARKRNLSHGYCPDCYRKTVQRIESNSVVQGFGNNQRTISLK